jgi:tetrahydromethanopterin S-methyltransferase subunit A
LEIEDNYSLLASEREETFLGKEMIVVLSLEDEEEGYLLADRRIVSPNELGPTQVNIPYDEIKRFRDAWELVNFVRSQNQDSVYWQLAERLLRSAARQDEAISLALGNT